MSSWYEKSTHWFHLHLFSTQLAPCLRPTKFKKVRKHTNIITRAWKGIVQKVLKFLKMTLHFLVFEREARNFASSVKKRIEKKHNGTISKIHVLPFIVKWCRKLESFVIRVLRCHLKRAYCFCTSFTAFPKEKLRFLRIASNVNIKKNAVQRLRIICYMKIEQQWYAP